MHTHFQHYLEWEVLDSTQEVTNLTFEKMLYNLDKSCIINFSRNSQYNLVATISGIISSKDELEPNGDEKDGAFVIDETVIGYSIDGHYKFKFSGVVIGSYTINRFSPHPFSAKFQAEFIFHKVERSIAYAAKEVVSMQEWFLTGNSNINFPRTTIRSLDKSFKKLRAGVDSEESEAQFRMMQSRGSGSDCLFAKFRDTAFIVAKVPEGFGPEWSFNITIEYRQAFGKIPSADEREAISELVGFVFGNQLLKVGLTTYDSSKSLNVQEYQNPWGDNVVSRCEKQAFPPVRINNYSDWWRSEILVNELIGPYLEQKNN